MPAWVFVVVFIGFSLWALKTHSTVGGTQIAHDAHLGGAFGGALLTILMNPDVLPAFFTRIGF